MYLKAKQFVGNKMLLVHKYSNKKYTLKNALGNMNSFCF